MKRFEELDWRRTPMGELTLRRRWDPAVNTEVYEIKLDDDFLMSSLFTVAEEEIAHRALAALPGTDLDIVVGGLGLGYTAQAILASDRVRSLVVIDALAEVIDWHQRALIPAGKQLAADSRCTLRHGDFFAMTRSAAGFDPDQPGRRCDAIVVDIDHSPRHLLNPAHADFYTASGLEQLVRHLRPGGVFTLWSNDPPDDVFTADLARHFSDVQAQVVSFDNPLQQRAATATVYIGTAPD